MSQEIKGVESSDPREAEADQERLSDDFDSSLLLPGWDVHKSSSLLRNPFHGCQGIVPVPTPEDSSHPSCPRGSCQVLGIRTERAPMWL